jgi:hypothetical protein
VGSRDRTAPRAERSRARSFVTHIASLTTASLWAVAQIPAAYATEVGPRNTLPAHFDQFLPPAQLESSAPSADPAQLNLLKRIEADDLRITGYVASRNGTEAPDYRVYVGVRYKSELGPLAQITSRAFYGSGTYDGLNSNGSAVPEDVRINSALPGNWLGADWKAESRLHAGHTFSAAVEVREQLPFDVLELNALTGNSSMHDPAQPTRLIGVVTQNDVALASDLALKVRMRYDERDGAFTPVTPRVELVYRPEQTSTVSAIFDETTGLEIGMERYVIGDARGRVSYTWQDDIAPLTGVASNSLYKPDGFDKRTARMSLDVPILPKRLSTSFELQYINVTGAVLGERRNDFVIGNLTLASAAISGDTRVTVGMHNLFDAQATGANAQVLAFAPTDGRSVRLDFTRRL